ncbi:hypothetical protein ABPG72_010243 [Tetrahymena utriculariae]
MIGNLDKKRTDKRVVIGSIPKNNIDLRILEKPEKYTLVQKKKTYQDIKFIITCLKNHFVFYNLQDSQLETLVNEMSYCEVNQGEQVIKQGDDAFCFFLLEKGEIEVQINQQKIRKLKDGEGFGELALLYNAPRSATCIALSKSYFWMIERNTFRKAVEEMITQEYQQNRKFIEKITFFQNLTSNQKDAIAGVLIDQRFLKEQNIVNKDDPASSFYIIKEGKVSVMLGNKEVRTLSQGESFGETALLQGDQTRTMTIKALEDTTCLALGRDVLTKLLGDKVEMIIYRNISKWALEKSDGFKELTINQLDKILDSIEVSHITKGRVIIPKGTQKAQQLYIILKGSAKDGDIVFQKSQLLGAKEIISGDETSMYGQNIVTEEDSVIGQVKISDLVAKLSGTLQDILKKNQKVSEQLEAKESQIRQNIENLTIDDLEVVKKLGNGQFGSVYLVKNKDTKQIYALKCVSKSSVVETSLEKHLIQEKKVMQTVNYPFIMRFFRSFKDEYYIYFLLEFIQGQELFEVIREIGLLSTWDSQFYVGSIILALEYLHSRKIIYRDIKPENIMITHKGYLKLIDMGTAKIMQTNAGTMTRTFTIIGTPHYMAPEVISGKGYSYLVDLWSVGICLYEFMCGYVPFGEEAEDPYEIYEEIIKKEINFPNYLNDPMAKSLMEQLLSRVPEMRTGGSYSSLKSHQFFRNVDWIKLSDMNYQPPYQPSNQSYLTTEQVLKAPGKQIQQQIKEEFGALKLPNVSKVVDWDKIF